MKPASVMLLGLAVAGCATSDRVTTTYENPSFQGSVSRILVVGAHENGATRRQFEESLVRALSTAGASGESSLAIMGREQELTAESLIAAAQRAGADAVLVTRVLDVQAQSEIEEGRSTAAAERRDDVPLADFFRYDYVEYQDPMTITTTHTVKVGSDLYTLRDQAKVWSVESTVFEKVTLTAVIDSITTAMTRQLRADGLID